MVCTHYRERSYSIAHGYIDNDTVAEQPFEGYIDVDMAVDAFLNVLKAHHLHLA